MMKIDKQIVIIGLLLNVLIVIIFYLRISKNQDVNDNLIKTQNLFEDLKQDVKESFSNNGNLIIDVAISCKMDESDSMLLSDKVDLPAFIIYIPYSEDVCMSCINFSINKVQSHFSNFKENNRIYIFTSKFNPAIKGRAYQKEIFHIVNCNKGFNIPADQVSMPHYFVLNENLIVTSFFTPSISYPDLVDDYLRSIKVFFDNSLKPTR